jgi:aldose 1-epimerase
MANVGVAEFGATASGHPVEAITLSSGALSVRLLTLGAILQDVRIAGVNRSLTLGSDRVADYEGQMHYHGALIAPVANRIARGEAQIAGARHKLTADSGHRHLLHSGPAGAHRKLWHLDHVAPDRATLGCDLPDGEGGFPGNRRVRVRYSVDGATLRMEVTATTDRPTLFNAANHSYWNLDGSESWQGHSLRIAADRYLPVTEELLPAGMIASVAGTEFDFRAGRVAGPGAPALDHCFCLSDGRRHLRPVLTLSGASGVTMTLSTTEPGVQVYDGRAAARPGRKPGEGVAIEAQGWPDAPNHRTFPSILLTPDATYRQITEWRFGRG